MDEHGTAADRNDPLSVPHPRRIDRRRFLTNIGLAAAGAAWAVTGLAGTARAASVARAASASRTGTGRSAALAAGSFAVPLDSVTHTRTWMAWPDSTAISSSTRSCPRPPTPRARRSASPRWSRPTTT